MQSILEFAGYGIYGALAVVALLGLFFTILISVRVAQKRFSDNAANHFLEEARVLLAQKDYDGVQQMCDSPGYWSKAVPQLMMVAVDRREESPSKLRRIIGERFERDILADLDYQASWIGTVVKSAPMLGLLGTVVGMIEAFGQIATGSQSGGTDVSAMAENIGFALTTTALGLSVAIPLVLASNIISVRIGKLQDSVQDQLGRFIDDLIESNTADQGTT